MLRFLVDESKIILEVRKYEQIGEKKKKKERKYANYISYRFEIKSPLHTWLIHGYTTW